MNCDNNLEIKETIQNYLNLANEIKFLECERDNVSKQFYANHSLTGGMPLGKAESIYHRAETTEQIALKLWAKESALQRKIDRLKQKQRLFQQYMGGEVLARLEQDLTRYGVTELVYQAYEAIGEVEYYLEQHKQAINPIKVVFDEEEAQRMDEIGTTFLTRLKELSL